jgi:ribosomal protein S12 methylthiotransferase
MNKNVFIISLGCAKNLTDSESMAYLLENEGYMFVDDIEQAGIVLINTCAFIQDAKEEAVREILNAVELKNSHPNTKIIVAGCLAQRYANELREEIPQIDALIGTGKYADIAGVLEQLQMQENVCITDDITGSIEETQRKIFTKKPVAYLKISEGCSRNCTYCIIPQLRGKYRSRKMEDIILEANSLALNGYNEIVLVAQDVTLYGIDLYKTKKLPELLTELNRIDKLKRIRLMYAYPEGIDDTLIACFKNLDKLQNYIDLPIQHVSDDILKKMGRHTSKKDIENLYTKLKREIPGICLRTTFIVGFPSESEEQFEEIVDFIEKYPFDKVGVFKYSQEEGTSAAIMPEQISQRIKTKRYHRLMKKQQQISQKINAALTGTMTEVLIYDTIEDNTYLGRTFRDAPDIDGGIIIHSPDKLTIGDYYLCQITGADAYDLRGTVFNNEFSQ